MLRRAAVLMAGLAMATTFGLAGAGMASAAAPALKVKNSALWTFEVTAQVGGQACEQEKFNATTHHFKAVNSELEKGTWTGGGSKVITMTWTHGQNIGAEFNGTFVVGSSPQEYSGIVSKNIGIAEGLLVKGAVPFFGGQPC